MVRISLHRLVSLFVGALLAFTISISAVAANDATVSMSAPVAATSAMQDYGCIPAPKMPGCEKANLCDLMCLTSAFTVPSDPVSAAVVDPSGRALAWGNELLTGRASPIDPSPPRLTYIA
ncbi:hypothetical protein [Devosia sp.]|uniref:hypothetical protein n=1 Tax=Devosia sp. TaxID=1871048 RepID=UPI003F723B24